MLKHPCAKDCQDRWANHDSNCHVSCPKWAKYWVEKQKEYELKLVCAKVHIHCDAYYKKVAKLKRWGAFR